MDNENDEREPRLFTLTEAERTRRQIEPVLIEAIELRHKLAPIEEELTDFATRIQWSGGMLVPYEHLAQLRISRNRLSEGLRTALETIQATGCVVKDLEIGLLDFPAILDEQEVYFCWRLGEERIRFWHRQDEGFASRKPIAPEDTGPSNPIQ